MTTHNPSDTGHTRTCSSCHTQEARPCRYLCDACLAVVTSDVAGLARLMGPLRAVAEKHVHTGNNAVPARSPAAQPSSPLRDDAWQLYEHATRLLRLTAIACHQQTAFDTMLAPGMYAMLILNNPTPLAMRADAAAWARDLHHACQHVRRILQPPQTRIAFGACPHCTHGIIRGLPTDTEGQCGNCQATVPRLQAAATLANRIRDDETAGTPTQLSRYCARAGIRVPASTIRSWIRRHKLPVNTQGQARLKDLVPLIQTWQ